MSTGTLTRPPDSRRSARVETRLRARRIAVRREQGRRRLRLVAWVLGALAVVAVLIALTRTALLDVDHLEFVGATHTSADDLRSALGFGEGAAMTDLDLRAAREQVAALPWVRDVHITRRWPNRVVVTVVERSPVAAVRLGTGVWVLVDRTGRALEQTVQPETGAAIPAVLIEGSGRQFMPGATVPGIDGPLRVAISMTRDLATWVEAIVPTDRGVDLALVGGGTAHLGAELDYAEELRALVSVLVRVDLGCLATIDVSAHSNPVVTRRDC